MKKMLFLPGLAVFLAACSAAPERTGINAVPAKLTAAVAKADLACQTDADCMAVKKGCCECAGYASVNLKSAEKIQKIWNQACQAAPCSREMCYVRIKPRCRQGVCTGKPKPADSYYGR